MNNHNEHKYSSNVHVKTDMDLLKQRLIDRDLTIVQLEAQIAQTQPDYLSQTQLTTLRSRCDHWQDKYERLLEAHKRIQKVNQGLEDKLLKLVDRSESEKLRLTSDSSNLTTALTTAARAINRLKQENERYKNDLSLAIRLVQCNPSQYGSHRLQSLPVELQQQVKAKLMTDTSKSTQKSEMKVIKVPIPTFPPTAMVYSVNKYEEKAVEEKPVDLVSAAIMAAVLEEREKERSSRHCPTCTCTSLTKNQSKQSSQDKVKYVSESHNYHKTHQSPDEETKSSRHNSSYDGRNNSLDESERPFNSHDTNSIQESLDIIDVGTQTVPSYIGQTGKVTSTCIYCHSDKTLSNESIYSSPLKSESRNDTKKPWEAQSCPWDWSLDSGSPSTPSSLTSASYESEASCLASPQDSPGRESLPSDKNKISSSNREENSSSRSSSLPSKKSIISTTTAPILNPTSTTTVSNKKSNVSTKSTPMRHGKSKVSPYHDMVNKVVQNSRKDYNLNTSLSESRKDFANGFPNGYKIPFNARSPHQDVFTPPIHQSPPPFKGTTNCDFKSVAKATNLGSIISSTSTASATETTL